MRIWKKSINKLNLKCKQSTEKMLNIYKWICSVLILYFKYNSYIYWLPGGGSKTKHLRLIFYWLMSKIVSAGFFFKFNTYVTVKKGTKLLRDYERSLLKGYRLFLVKIEKMANVLHKKKGDNRVRSEVCTFLKVTY